MKIHQGEDVQFVLCSVVGETTFQTAPRYKLLLLLMAGRPFTKSHRGHYLHKSSLSLARDFYLSIFLYFGCSFLYTFTHRGRPLAGSMLNIKFVSIHLLKIYPMLVF